MNFKHDLLLPSFSTEDFNPTKLRDLQNLDWSEDSVLQGLNYERGFLDPASAIPLPPDPSKALDFYTNAVELDPLNKQAFQLKGLLLKSLGRFPESEEALKQAFKLDPEDSELEILLQDMMLRNRTAATTGTVTGTTTGREAEMKEAENELRGIRDTHKYEFV